MILATLCSSSRNADYLPEDRQQVLADFEIGHRVEQVFYVKPIKPDILGEFCLLNGGVRSTTPAYLLPSGDHLANDNRLKELVIKAWGTNPEGVASFFSRCVADFMDNENLSRMLS